MSLRGKRVQASSDADQHPGKYGRIAHLDGDGPTEEYPDGFDNAGSGENEVWVEWDDSDTNPCWMETRYLL